MAAYGRHILVSTAIFRFGVQTADTVIIGKTLGPASLGQFRYAFRIATLPYTVLLAGAGYVIFPALARIKADRERLRAAFLRSLRWMAVLGVPAGMILIPVGPALTVIAFGEVWHPAGQAAIALCAYAGASAITATVSELLKADGTPAPLTQINLTITLVTAAAMLALSPLGLSAAAAGLSVGALAGTLYSLRVARRGLGVPAREMVPEIWPAVFAATLAALLVLPLDRFVLEPAERGLVAGLALLAVEGIAYVIAYVGTLRLIAPAHSGEILGMLMTRGRGDQEGR
jgi:PST family polysaccharide transporter